MKKGYEKRTIAIDARCLTIHKTGIQTYVIELVKRLVKEFNITLYTHKNLHPSCSINLAKEVNLVIKVVDNFLSFYGTVWAQLSLPVLIRNDQPDFFWSPDHTLPFISQFFIRKKTKLIVTVHDLAYLEVPQYVTKLNWLNNKLFLKSSVQMADLVLVDSNTTMEAVKTNFSKIRNIELLYIGYTAREYKQKVEVIQKYDLRKKNYFLFVGNLEGKKNLLRAVQAFELVSSEMKNMVFAIVGGKGWKADEEREYFKTLENKGLLRIIGYVSDDELATLYNDSFAFIFPSIYEGFGIPPLEAMSYGIPVIASNASTIPEVCGDAALYFDPFNINSIKEIMEVLYKDPIVYNQLSVAGKIRCKMFSWDESFVRFVDLVNKL